ncbi:MAG: c-type cytochrome [Candidatus Brocadiales bacterium]|nr:c-type cytochrome [Candidatus Bathyanammoxibius sp.]
MRDEQEKRIHEENNDDRLPRIPLIAMVSILVVTAVVVSLYSFKAFSPEAIKRAALPPEKHDPLLDALLEISDGLDNTALTGRGFYTKYCNVCHGEEGKGDGFNAYSLKPRPVDLSKEIFGGDKVLTTTITNGFTGKDGVMRCPSWSGVLREDEVQATVLYVKQFSAKPPKLELTEVEGAEVEPVE